MSVPHITIKRDCCSSDGWCVHYAGLYKPGLREGRITHCKAGVEYDSVKKEVDYTYSYVGGDCKFTGKQARPCYKHQAPLTDGCPKCRYPSAEEIADNRREIDKLVGSVAVARTEILCELERRHKNGDPGVKLNVSADPECEDGPTNFLSGSGKVLCPVCNKGLLNYYRSDYNGHVHAHCSTDGCVGWTE